jgi:hypothetical protein
MAYAPVDSEDPLFLTLYPGELVVKRLHMQGFPSGGNLLIFERKSGFMIAPDGTPVPLFKCARGKKLL